MDRYLVFGIVTLFSVSSVRAKDYCKAATCGQLHIGCKNNGKIAGSCSKFSKFFDLNDLKDVVVEKHNYYRNKIASGSIRGFKPAERMATIAWDDELAYLAGLNVKTCDSDHDLCRDTENYIHSGQNLAYLWMINQDKSIKEVISNSIDGWFSEYKDATMASINMFGSQQTEKIIGHFTVMVADRNTKVGCAALKKDKDKSHEYLIACNYATTNMAHEPIYKSGKPASKCTTGRNAKYPALCSPTEPIDPNDFNHYH